MALKKENYPWELHKNLHISDFSLRFEVKLIRKKKKT